MFSGMTIKHANLLSTIHDANIYYVAQRRSQEGKGGGGGGVHKITS